MKSASAGIQPGQKVGGEITDGRRLVNRVWMAALVTLGMFIASLVFVADFAGNLANRMTLQSEQRLVALEFDRLAHSSLRNMRLLTRNDTVFSSLKGELELEQLRPEIVPKAWNSFGFEAVVFFAGDAVKATAWLTQVSPQELDPNIRMGAFDLVTDIQQQFDSVKVETRRGAIVPTFVKDEPLGLTNYAFRFINGKLRLLIAQPVMAESIVMQGIEGNPIIAVASIPIGETLLAEMGTRLHLHDLHLDRISTTPDAVASTAISNGPADPVLHATWLPVPPRFAILRGVAPTIAFLLVVAAVAVYIIGARFGSTLRALAASESQNRHLAHHDGLTGLANRSKFDLQIDEAIEKARDKPFALLAIDLDHFKQANDSFGHEAGDHVLRTVARRMNSIVSPIGELSRIGGDEFMAIVHGIHDREALEFLCESLIECACQPVSFEGNSISIGSSIGVAHAPTDGDSVGELMRNADEALYFAKDAGRGRVIFKGDSRGELDRRSNRANGGPANRKHPAPEVRVARREA
ncbi:MAG: GGDEF domain-containing protein [Pseudomonadota bacterium]